MSLRLMVDKVASGDLAIKKSLELSHPPELHA